MEEFHLLFVIIALTFLFYFSKRFFFGFGYWKKRGVPHPKPIPFFGNTFGVTCGNESLFDFHLKNYRQFERHKFSAYYDFSKPVLVVRDPDLISHILIKDFAYFQDRGFPYDEEKEPLTANLFNMGGQRWKNVRTKTTSCFTTGKRKLMFDMIIDLMLTLNNTINKSLEGGDEIEIKDILARFSTDVITESAFGIKANSLENPEADFRRMGRTLVKSNSRIRPIFLEICPKIMQYFGVRFLSKEMNDFFVSFVKEAIEFRKHNRVNRNDFLNSMIELMEQQNTRVNDEYSDKEDITYATIAAECWFFFFAGFEASALVVSMTLFELARNPDIQTKLRQEVDTVLAKYNGQVTFDALQEMTFMEMVVYETIRLYPSLPFIIRSCTKKYRIPDTDVVIDKGVNVVIPVVGIHRDAKYYDNPDNYNPTNFSEDMKNKRRNCTYLPFGEGPRICIASRFGMMQIKTGLATVIRNFEFSPSPKMQVPLHLTPRLILTNCPEVWLKCTKRIVPVASDIDQKARSD